MNLCMCGHDRISHPSDGRCDNYLGDGDRCHCRRFWAEPPEADEQRKEPGVIAVFLAPYVRPLERPRFEVIEQNDVAATVQVWTDESPQPAYEAWMKWDGCIELTRFLNYGRDIDRIHICDAVGLARILEELETRRIAMFEGGDGEDKP